MADGFDNSDDAGATELHITVLSPRNDSDRPSPLVAAPDEPEERILLRDNGSGMTPDQALKCASIAFTKPAAGRIGMVRLNPRPGVALTLGAAPYI